MLRNVGSSWVRNLVTAVSGFLTTPYILHALGDPANIWEVINGYTGILALLALGIPMASSRIFAQEVALEDRGALNAAIGSCAALYAVVGVLALAVGAFQLWAFETVYVARDDISFWPEHVPDARLAFVLTVVFMAVNFYAQIPYGVMVAHQDFVVANLVATGALVLKLGLIVLVLAVAPSVTALAAITLGIVLFEFGTANALMKRRYPGVRIRLGGATFAHVRRILGFSAWVLLLNLGIKLAFNIDGMVLSAFGEEQDPYQYKAANMLMLMLVEFLVTIGAVAMPRVTQLSVKGDLETVRALYLQWTKVALSLTLLAGLYLLVLGPEFLAAWMGQDAFRDRGGRVLQILMASCFVFMPVRGVSLGFLMGLGDARRPGMLFLAMGLANLGLSLILVQDHGILGVALGTAIPNVLFAFLIALLVCRRIGLPMRTFLLHTAGRALPAAVPVTLLLLWMKHGLRPDSLFLLVLLGVLHVALFTAVWVAFVYRGDPHIDAWGRLRRLLRIQPGS